ncbi:Flp1 family type IVb pilin [Paenibacillus sp. NFR01]|uniref:Flp1 family type IVb pilin n=1 Tax=Paenibacillus sp. NFR01 TaxID=1566279 RepID=UPI0008C0CA91|nr:Flp1 family type IVb pilin [Paenibacillus sp. NFR01]SET95392.1 Putative Flagellin, Flp1-like, domain [Paenibacillus sp. NFR01]
MTSNFLKHARQFWNEEEGLGSLEMILIISVLIAVVLLFKDKIKEVVSDLIDTAGEKSQQVFE